jgi:hypothetical protein
MADEVKERRRIYHGTYTNIVIRPHERNGTINSPFPHKYYTVIIHNSMELPMEIDNVKFMSGAITVFDFAGTIWVGGDNKSELTIYEYPNKVIQGEIRVK